MLFPKIIRLNEVSQLEWYVDRDMLKKHAVTVMEGLGAAVESLEDSHFLNGVLIALGQTHAKRNMKPTMLKVSDDVGSEAISTIMSVDDSHFLNGVLIAWPEAN